MTFFDCTNLFQPDASLLCLNRVKIMKDIHSYWTCFLLLFAFSVTVMPVIHSQGLYGYGYGWPYSGYGGYGGYPYGGLAGYGGLYNPYMGYGYGGLGGLYGGLGYGGLYGGGLYGGGLGGLYSPYGLYGGYYG